MRLLIGLHGGEAGRVRPDGYLGRVVLRHGFEGGRTTGVGLICTRTSGEGGEDACCGEGERCRDGATAGAIKSWRLHCLAFLDAGVGLGFIAVRTQAAVPMNG
ncbi:hypothetical protein N136_00061 [Leifsonia aquatica ATCC 14665]|uniref:Uncharacterized protein n=1 Tax=Leifsonia aquatica ATCC 14665 TaxID=1358026 RepID=U2T7R4_LEIAQ|nr:hypothetical protein N136_00061 [Leifsonia aquatica ATCC 14665]